MPGASIIWGCGRERTGKAYFDSASTERLPLAQLLNHFLRRVSLGDATMLEAGRWLRSASHSPVHPLLPDGSQATALQQDLGQVTTCAPSAAFKSAISRSGT